jgi:mxaK protein
MGLKPRWALFALAALALAAAVEGHGLQGSAHTNKLIQNGPLPPAAAGVDSPAELRFAQAQALGASGATDQAINRYGALSADTALGQAARYNAANLLLRQALDLHNQQRAGQALALVELAKESYRQVLRVDPENWPARYNLERAQRLLPDPEADAEDSNQAPLAAERSATTMRGYSPGLP